MRLGGTEGFLLLSGLSPRDRRAVLVGLAIFLPALLWVLAVRPYRAALADARERVVAERDLLERELALLERGPELRAAIQLAVEEAEEVEGRVLRAPSLVLAEGELTDFVEGAALRSRVLLEEIRGGEMARGEEPPPGLEVVRLHLRGESDLQGILTLLGEIESAPLLLRVKGLALEPETARPESNGREEAPRQAVPTGVVGFQLILDGYSAAEAGPGTGAESAAGER